MGNFEWHKSFFDGREEVEDDERPCLLETELKGYFGKLMKACKGRHLSIRMDTDVENTIKETVIHRNKTTTRRTFALSSK